MGKNVPEFSESVKKKIKSYRWPGNVRELQNAVERAMIISGNNIIGIKDIMLPDESIITLPESIIKGDLKQAVSRAVEYVEKRRISEVLENTNFNKSKASGILKISYKSLLEKIKKYGLEKKN